MMRKIALVAAASVAAIALARQRGEASTETLIHGHAGHMDNGHIDESDQASGYLTTCSMSDGHVTPGGGGSYIGHILPCKDDIASHGGGSACFGHIAIA